MTRSVMHRRQFEPFDALMHLQNELEQVLEQPFGWFRTSPSGRGAFPPASVFRGEAGYVIRMELPGLTPDQVQVDTHLDSVRVSGKRETGDAAGTAHRLERWSGEFSRGIRVPSDADTSRAQARYRSGVLSIDIPLREEAKPRRIEIQ